MDVFGHKHSASLLRVNIFMNATLEYFASTVDTQGSVRSNHHYTEDIDLTGGTEHNSRS